MKWKMKRKLRWNFPLLLLLPSGGFRNDLTSRSRCVLCGKEERRRRRRQLQANNERCWVRRQAETMGKKHLSNDDEWEIWISVKRESVQAFLLILLLVHLIERERESEFPSTDEASSTRTCSLIVVNKSNSQFFFGGVSRSHLENRSLCNNFQEQVFGVHNVKFNFLSLSHSAFLFYKFIFLVALTFFNFTRRVVIVPGVCRPKIPESFHAHAMVWQEMFVITSRRESGSARETHHISMCRCCCWQAFRVGKYNFPLRWCSERDHVNAAGEEWSRSLLAFFNAQQRIYFTRLFERIVCILPRTITWELRVWGVQIGSQNVV